MAASYLKAAAFERGSISANGSAHSSIDTVVEAAMQVARSILISGHQMESYCALTARNAKSFLE
jgi:mRNA degradation ribonuclease J1/J2